MAKVVKGIPLDAPLYEVDVERGVEYRNCEAIFGVFTTRNVTTLLPEGLKPASEPALGGIWIAHYSFSTVGEYYEYVALVQVQDEEGDVGFYIPYIYVTNDSALAAGREIAGAPKKLAKIGLVKESEVVMGYLERPAGKRLVTFVVAPTRRAPAQVIETFFPPKRQSFLYSLRHLPPVGPYPGVTQLVKWFSSIDLHLDPRGERVVFIGPGNITYDSPSVIDPVHRLEIENIIATLYFQFDMKLGFVKILKEYKE